MKNYITALSMAFAITLPHAALAQTVTPPAVPAGLEIPEGNHAFLLGHGVGTQNYVCAPTDKLGHVDWILFTPQATLFSDDQLQLTTHFFSPNPDEGSVVRVTWEDSTDTSTVWARLIASSTDARFVDPNAVFLFVTPPEVLAVGERFNAAPFDVENVFWSHRGELCTFDVMIEEFGLATPPLLRRRKATLRPSGETTGE